MDAVEIGRRLAAGLFENAEKDGVDPWKPYEIALHAARGQGVAVEKVAKGHVGLVGGRANYDPEFRSVMHEDTGSAFSDAFLVGHEIGHVVLGDDKVADVALSVDEERAADAAPIGVDRVQDYGRTQRREIQMDLFARELLLPRPRARALHVEGGLTATTIADRLGARFGTIAQQMLDALLLPETLGHEKPTRPPRPLNDQQRQAAHHSGSPYLLEAGPGTGKTQTLIGRIEWLLAKEVDPRKILVLTFSNKAAGELIERISDKAPHAAAAMWVGTFHAFGLDLLKRYAAQLELPDPPRMIDRAEAIDLIERELPRLALKHYRNLWDPTQDINDILQAISRAKDEVASAADYMRLGEAMKARAEAATPVDAKALESAEKAIEVARVYQRYEELKGVQKSLDFGDLVALPVNMLEKDAAIRDSVAAQYEHVLVDEYQDVNRSSVRLLKAIVGNGENLWVVGDIRQSIYRFRGASSVNVDLFDKEDFPNATMGRLSINYRSSSGIVDAVSDFADGMKAGRGRTARLSSDRGPNGYQPEFRRAATADDEVAALVEAIEEMKAQGHAYRDQAVLCTGNDKLARFGAGLESMGIPVLHLGSVFERPEIKDLLSILTLLVDGKGLGLARLVTMPPFRMSLADLGALVEHLRDIQGRDWRTVELPIEGLSAEGERALIALRSLVTGMDRRSRPWDVLSRVILDRTAIAADLAKSTTIADRAAGIAIWQFMNFVRSAPRAASPILDMLDRIRRLVAIADDRDLRQLPFSAQGLDAVRLMTVHGSKGLEFSVVHLPGLTAASLPRSAGQIRGVPPPDRLVEYSNGRTGIEVRAGAHDEEQECLFYVATSRARDRLMCYAQSLSSDGKNMKPSRFIEIVAKLRRDVVPTLRLPPSPEDRRIEVVYEEAPSFTGQQILQYDKCPRRFFYTYLLKVGGRQSETSFMRMHNATRQVVEWMVGQDPDSVEVAEIERRLGLAFDAERFGEDDRQEYLDIARSLALTLHENRVGQARQAVTKLSFDTGHGSIEVVPDEVLIGTDGIRAVRSIRTGHITSDSMDDLAAAAFVIAAGQDPTRPRADLVYLADALFEPISLKPQQVDYRRDKIVKALKDVAEGAFGTKPSNYRCPKCPAFFFCGPVPDGTLTKKVGTTLPNSSSASD